MPRTAPKTPQLDMFEAFGLEPHTDPPQALKASEVDRRPLPLIIAGANDFKLQWTEDNGAYLFNVNDWIAGVFGVDSQTASKRWADAKRDRRTKETSPIGEVSRMRQDGEIRQFTYTATDGKKYKRDYVTEAGLYQITQRLNADTPLAESMRKYLSKAGVAIDRAATLAAQATKDESRFDHIPCIIAPHDAPLSASSEDVLLYYVAMHNDGMLTGMLEFTDFDEVYWDDEEDEWDYDDDDDAYYAMAL